MLRKNQFTWACSGGSRGKALDLQASVRAALSTEVPTSHPVMLAPVLRVFSTLKASICLFFIPLDKHGFHGRASPRI